MDISTLLAAAGWIGAVCTVTAYGLLSSGKLTADAPAFQVSNLTGSLLLLASAVAVGSWPSVAVNVVWIAIAAQAIVLFLVAIRRRRRVFAMPSAPVPEGLAPTLAMPIVTEAMLDAAAAEREPATPVAA